MEEYILVVYLNLCQERKWGAAQILQRKMAKVLSQLLWINLSWINRFYRAYMGEAMIPFLCRHFLNSFFPCEGRGLAFRHTPSCGHRQSPPLGMYPTRPIQYSL
jgi:hypothetical protein